MSTINGRPGTLLPCLPRKIHGTYCSIIRTLDWKHCFSTLNNSPKLHNSRLACTCIAQRTFQEKCVAGLYGVVTVQWLPIMYFHIEHVGSLPDYTITPWTIPMSIDYCVYNWFRRLSINWNCPGNWFRRLSINWNCPDNWFRRLSINWNCPDNWFRRLSINYNCSDHWFRRLPTLIGIVQTIDSMTV